MCSQKPQVENSGWWEKKGWDHAGYWPCINTVGRQIFPTHLWAPKIAELIGAGGVRGWKEMAEN